MTAFVSSPLRQAINLAADTYSRRLRNPGGKTLYVGTGTYSLPSGDTVTATDGAESEGWGLEPYKPLATLTAAYSRCSGSFVDYVLLLPNHTETYTAAGALTLNKQNVVIESIGIGESRAQILLDAGAAIDIDVTSPNNTMRGIIFKAGHADMTACIDLDATDFWLDECEFRDNTTNENWVDYILTGGDNTCDRLKVTNCRSVSADTGNDSFLNGQAGDIDGLVFTGNHIQMGVQNNEPIIEMTGKSLTACSIINNLFYRLNTDTATKALVESDQTDNSGEISYNRFSHRDSGSEVPIDLTGAAAFENYNVGAVDVSGYILPTRDS